MWGYVEKTVVEDHELCSQCGGSCCSQLPGGAFPEDFADEDALRAAIATGKWAIDWWEGDPGDGDERTAYYVRPATKGKEGLVYDPSWGGECCFLSEVGCELDPLTRPKTCRELQPLQSGECRGHQGIGKNAAALAWRPFFDTLDSYNDDDGV